jgi:uncharacterized protein
MKALVLLLVVLAGVWLWRNRSAPDRVAPPKAPASAEPLDMVCCAQCGVHVPGNEAVVGKQGSYCSVKHLHQSES